MSPMQGREVTLYTDVLSMNALSRQVTDVRIRLNVLVKRNRT